MTVLHDILMNRNAQPIFDASDFIQKVRFAAYLKKVTENKVTKNVYYLYFGIILSVSTVAGKWFSFH